MEKERVLLFVFCMVLIFSLFMLIVQYSKLTEFATTGSTVSNVTISNYLSISMSTNLGTGILFGSVNALPATDVNATHNYDGGSSASSMFINVSTDGNTNVDFCILGNADLRTSGADIIGLGNETYANATVSSDGTSPPIAKQTVLTTGYVKAGQNIAKGNVSYYRLWLDVPAAQAAGTYNNTVSFEGVVTGASC